METHIKTKYGLIKYFRSKNLSLEEASFLTRTVRDAFLYLNKTLEKLSEKKEESDLFRKIFGNTDKNEVEILLKSAISRFKNLEIVKEKERFEGDSSSRVLASVGSDSSIKIYETFFNTREIPDNRAGVIIHEIAHLCGLRGENDTEMHSLESAESVKNFCLITNGIVQELDARARNIEEAQSKSDELCYNPDQPRAPKGQSNGGQWVSEGSSDSDGNTSKSSMKNSEEDPANKSNSIDDKDEEQEYDREEEEEEEIRENNVREGTEEKISSYKSESTTITRVDDYRNSTDEKVELEDDVKLDYSENGDPCAWAGISFSDKDKSYGKGEKVAIVAELEYEKDKSGKIEKTAVMFEEIANGNNEIKMQRLAIVEVYKRRDDLTRLEIKLRLSTVDRENAKKFIVSQASKYNRSSDEGNKQPITTYAESHYIENRKEGKITNYDEVKTNESYREKTLYIRRIYLDLETMSKGQIK